MQYIDPSDFVDKFFPIDPSDKQYICWTLTERYKFDKINENLLEEMDWLKSVRKLLVNESEQRKGKVSGYCLEMLVKYYLNEAIQNLEATAHRLQQSQNNTAIGN